MSELRGKRGLRGGSPAAVPGNGGPAEPGDDVPVAPIAATLIEPVAQTVAETASTIAAGSLALADSPVVPSPPTGGDAWTALAESQAALARGVDALAGELSAIARAAVGATIAGANAMVGATTWSDAIDAHIGLARRGFDTAIEGSARLSAIAVRLALDTAQPLFAGSRLN